MTTYILKTGLCSALLLTFYFLFLQREKMHHFNRFYLLLSIIVSFTIPLITICNVELPQLNAVTQFIDLPMDNTPQNIPHKIPIATQPINYLFYFLMIAYLCVTVFLLLRFIKNIASLYHSIKINHKVRYDIATLVLTKSNTTTHSFLQYIFLDKEAFENATIEKEILSHELTHVKQKHSLDILLVEILLIFCWFNPFLFLYRKAIQLNHEFLADDAVVKTFNDTTAYQYLLLKKSSQAKGLQLTSQFNYLITKKRLLMLSTKTSPKIALLKQLTLLPVLAMAVFIFSTKSFAQKTPPIIKDTPKEAPSTIAGASPELMAEYETIINKYKGTDNKWMLTFAQKITTEEKERLKNIFVQMSKEQQQKQTVGFMPAFGPLPKVVPAKEQFETFKNENVYGIWIDNKKVSNTALDKYSNTDFEHVFVSKLYGAAKKGKPYTHQVDLMTTTCYEINYRKSMAMKNTLVMYVGYTFNYVKRK